MPSPEPDVLARLVDTKAAAALVGLRPETLRQQLFRGNCPWTPYRLRVGGRAHLRWDPVELAESLVREVGGAQ